VALLAFLRRPRARYHGVMRASLAIVLVGLLHPTWALADGDARLPGYWLGRAEAEVRKADLLELPKDTMGLRALDVAAIIWEVEPSDARRKWLADMAAAIEARLDGAEPQQRVAALGTLAYVYRRALGDQPGYQRALGGVRAAIDRKEIKDVLWMSAQFQLVFTMAVAGDLDGVAREFGRIQSAQDRMKQYSLALSMLSRMNRPKETRELIVLLLKSAQELRDDEPFKEAMRDVARAHARIGAFEDAFKALAPIDKPYIAYATTADVMEIARRAGAEDAYVKAYDRTSELVGHTYKGTRRSLAWQLLHLGDKPRARAQARLAADEARQNDQWFETVPLATIFAWAGDGDRYKEWLERTRRRVDKLGDGGPQALTEPSNLQKEIARARMSLASVYAQAGDLDAMRREIAAAERIKGLTDGDLGEERPNLIAALCRTGNWDEAQRQIEALHGVSWQGPEYLGFARALLDAGEFERAKAAARKVSGSYRLRAWHAVSRWAVDAAKFDGLEKWVDELENPLQRALANINVAQRIKVGKGGRMWWMFEAE
jgi:tetratricopeptide (TPR) repeat protein